MIAKLAAAVTNWEGEERALVRFVAQLELPAGTKALDIGCGYGRFMTLLSARGLDMTGVDANPECLSALAADGMRCLSVDELAMSDERFDLLVMSHIVEHNTPRELFEMLDGYLDRLTPGGHVVIATPLLSKYFYDDFDHVRPYHPASFHLVFEAEAAQVKYRARNRLELVDIWFRTAPCRFHFRPGLYVRGYSRWPVVANLALAALFKISNGAAGRVDAWMGLYRTTGPTGHEGGGKPVKP